MTLRRTFLVAALTLGALFIGPRGATAGYWSWLEQFSGPGPLKGWTVLSTLCVQDRSAANDPDKVRSLPWPSPIGRSNAFHQRLLDFADKNAKPFGVAKNELYRRLLANPLPESLVRLSGASSTDRLSVFQTDAAPEQPLTDSERADLIRDRSALLRWATLLATSYGDESAQTGAGHRDRATTCGYFDFGRFHSQVAVGAVDDRGFPNVTGNMYDVGPSVRLHDGLDIGGGFGRISFTARPPLQPELSLGRWTITPFRSVIRPLLMAVPEHHRKQWMGVVSLYWKETYIAGKLTGEDFGVAANRSGAAYQVDGELVRSFGIIFDASALLPTGRR